MAAMAAAGRDDPLILGVNGSKPLAWCEAKIGTEIQHKPQGHWSAGAGPAGYPNRDDSTGSKPVSQAGRVVLRNPYPATLHGPARSDEGWRKRKRGQ
jgi:hypothetical protein